MNANYYDALLPVGELDDEGAAAIARLRLPYRTVASVFTPAGRIVVSLVSDSSRLSGMFADNWAPAADQEPHATLYALDRPAGCYGLDDALDGARWWSPGARTMAVFGGMSYRLVKVCVRGICSAVSGDDIVFLHGCSLSIGAGRARRGVVITGGSGAGKTTLVARLLRRADRPVTVLNDDWGAVSLASANAVSTGERMLHMKASSVLALRPGFFATARRGSYAPDLTEPDRARVLVSPQAVYGSRWDTRSVMVDQLIVIVREQPGWVPPRHPLDAISALATGSNLGAIRHHQAFLNGSLLLRTPGDQLREERRYRRLLERVAVSWINNDGSADGLAANFAAALTKPAGPGPSM
jgi:CobW/HypB/UreG family nucleotide-binding protein